MSVARKCNKCKKCFDPFEIKGQMCSFTNPVFRTSMDIKEHYHGEYLDESEGPDGVIDLCPDCARKFKAFMDPNVNVLPENYLDYACLNDKSSVRKIPEGVFSGDIDGDGTPIGGIVKDYLGTNFSKPYMK